MLLGICTYYKDPNQMRQDTGQGHYLKVSIWHNAVHNIIVTDITNILRLTINKRNPLCVSYGIPVTNIWGKIDNVIACLHYVMWITKKFANDELNFWVPLASLNVNPYVDKTALLYWIDARLPSNGSHWDQSWVHISSTRRQNAMNAISHQLHWHHNLNQLTPAVLAWLFILKHHTMVTEINKPLPEPMLTQISVTIWRHQPTVS